MAEIAEETARRHADAFGDAPVFRHALDVGGEYAFRLRGESHTWTPDSVAICSMRCVSATARAQVP